jgi:hypothetical protein
MADDAMHARVRYLDVAIRHFGLSFGIREAADFSAGNSGAAGDPGPTPDGCLTGGDAHNLVAIAQVGLCKRYGLAYPRPEDHYLDIPGLGAAAARVVLCTGLELPTPAWLTDARYLDPVPTHFLVGFDPSGPRVVHLFGWATHEEVLRAGARPLVRGGPEVYHLPFENLHPPEERRDG